MYEFIINVISRGNILNQNQGTIRKMSIMGNLDDWEVQRNQINVGHILNFGDYRFRVREVVHQLKFREEQFEDKQTNESFVKNCTTLSHTILVCDIVEVQPELYDDIYRVMKEYGVLIKEVEEEE